MSVQLALPSMKPPKPTHDYSAQLKAIVGAIGDGELRTLAQIEAAMDFRYAQTSISARLRELHRKYLPGWDSKHVISKLPNGPRHWYRVFRERTVTAYEFPVTAMLTDAQANRNGQRVRGSESAAEGDAHAMPESRPVAQSASPDFYPHERRIRDRQLTDHLQFMEGA